MLPFIISTRRFEMESPRPVPPYLRVVEVSAWENAWNSRALCSGVMPMPLSRTANFSLMRSVSLLLHGDPHQHVAALSELDSVIDEVDEDLSEAQWVTHKVGRDVGLRGDEELEILFVGLLADDVRQIVENVFELEVSLDLGEIEDVIDDGEQRLRGRFHLVAVETCNCLSEAGRMCKVRRSAAA